MKSRRCVNSSVYCFMLRKNGCPNCLEDIMKRISILALSFVCVLNFVVPDCLYGQSLSAVPVDMEILIAPSPIKADGKIQLVYELHLTNFRAKNLELTRAEVFGGANK